MWIFASNFQVDLTMNGKQMLSNFLFDICKLTPNFTMVSRKDTCVKYIKEMVGKDKVLVSLFLISFVIVNFFGVIRKFNRKTNRINFSLTLLN